jgi:Right handed beta helix region
MTEEIMRTACAKRSHSIALGSSIIVMLAAITFGLTFPSTSYAQTTLTVCASGCNYTTIASAVAAVSSGDTISVQEATDSESTSVDIGNNLTLTIEGLGVSSTTVNGTGTLPVFIIESGSTVTIQNLTVSNGFNSSNGGGIVNNGGSLTISNAAVSNNTSSSGSGGGIANLYSGSLTINNSTVSGNMAASGSGGGIQNSSSTVTITSSTISGNTAYIYGAGIYNSGTVTTTNSTLSGNYGVLYGGGIYSDSGSSVTISFSTIANNSASTAGGIDNLGTATVDDSIIGDNTGGDCAGTISAPSNTSSSLDTDGTCRTASFAQVTPAQLNLAPLALNSPGTTETLALLSPSSAVDAAPNCKDAGGATITTDQRGVLRPQPQGGACDIGAYELQSGTATASVSTVTDLGVPGASNDSPTGPNVTMGAFVHDNATVTTTVNVIPSGSSVTFNVFPVASCGGTPSSSDTVSLNSGSSTESVESSGTTGVSAFGPLAVGGVAYRAAFNSSDTTSVPNSTGVCETLNVQSPIDQFGYTLNSGTSLYTCTLESMASNNNTCPTGQQEATVGAGTTNNFVIDVEVTNLTGMPVVEYVTGSLAKGSNFSYTGVTTTCGNAIAKNNGTVLWNNSGSHSPNATGFTMNPGDVCDLYATVTATFTSTGQQAIASQWSASQTETSPVTGQSVTLTSPVTGSLAVDVQ